MAYCYNAQRDKQTVQNSGPEHITLLSLGETKRLIQWGHVISITSIFGIRIKMAMIIGLNKRTRRHLLHRSTIVCFTGAFSFFEGDIILDIGRAQGRSRSSRATLYSISSFAQGRSRSSRATSYSTRSWSGVSWTRRRWKNVDVTYVRYTAVRPDVTREPTSHQKRHRAAVCAGPLCCRENASGRMASSRTNLTNTLVYAWLVFAFQLSQTGSV